MRRAADVLLFLEGADRAGSRTAAEVAAAVGLNRTTAWRYLQTLSATGLVRDLGEGRFGLGPRTLSLAQAYVRQWGNLEEVAGAALVRLRDTVGETAALHVRHGWSRVVVRQVESRHELHRTYREIGQPIPLHAGAPSLAILAALPDAHRRAYLAANVDSAERAGLERTLDAIARSGYAASRGARVAGVASVAAAVRDADGQVVAALNTTGPMDRLPESRLGEVAAAVLDAATWVERQLVAPAGGAAAGAPLANSNRRQA